MESFTFLANDETQTAEFGAALARALPRGAVVGLHGTLGAGKTRLVQAMASAYGIDPHQVVSPTFVIMQPYEGDRTVYHFDAYRIRSDEEFLDLGPDDYFESDGLVVIEWADRVEHCLPRERVDVYMEVAGPSARRIEVHPTGEKYASLVGELGVSGVKTGIARPI